MNINELYALNLLVSFIFRLRKT